MKPETKRETLIARAAFVEGCQTFGISPYTATEHGNRRYPLPKITRPRVVKDDKGDHSPSEFRVVGGRLEYRNPGALASWLSFPDSNRYLMSAERARIIG